MPGWRKLICQYHFYHSDTSSKLLVEARDYSAVETFRRKHIRPTFVGLPSLANSQFNGCPVFREPPGDNPYSGTDKLTQGHGLVLHELGLSD